MKSIVEYSNEKCFVCHSYRNLENHHIFYGNGRRKKSDKYGLTVTLCAEHHRGTNGVHGKKGKKFNKELKRYAQHKFEELYSHEDWMAIFHKNYL